MIAVNGNFRARDARRDRLVGLARTLGHRHRSGAVDHDRSATVHRALIDDLCAHGYHAAPIEHRYGGGGHRLVDIVMAQACLAEFDPATALGIGMHLMVVGGETWQHRWPEWRRRDVFREVTERGALLNVFATEPEIGSPQGVEAPRTALRPVGEGRWELHGVKSYSTFAPALTYALVHASVSDGSGDVARVIVRMDDPCVRITETWDAIGMRATASHEVAFEGVPVRDADLLARHPFSVRAQRPAMSPWFALPVAAAYLGIARAARDEAVTSLERAAPFRTPLAMAEGQHLLGEIEHRLTVAESILTAAAAEADDDRRTAAGLSPLEAAAKLEVTRAATEVVDLAVRVAGGSALQRGGRLERAWRDVRSGSVHPPTEASALGLLASEAIERTRQATLVAQ